METGNAAVETGNAVRKTGSVTAAVVSQPMTQPSFVPIAEADQVRPARSLRVPQAWSPDRPAEIRVPARNAGVSMGTPGPDQGFALRLARRFADRLHLTEGESTDDVVVGCALIASRRAGLFGRAPSVHDLNVAFSLWGFLGTAPADLVQTRKRAFLSAAHHYEVQRQLVDAVPETTLRLSPADVADRAGGDGWRALLGDPSATAGHG